MRSLLSCAQGYKAYVCITRTKGAGTMSTTAMATLDGILGKVLTALYRFKVGGLVEGTMITGTPCENIHKEGWHICAKIIIEKNHIVKRLHRILQGSYCQESRRTTYRPSTYNGNKTFTYTWYTHGSKTKIHPV